MSEQYPGEIKNMKLLNKGEKNVYKVNISNEQGSYEIVVDAQNGDIKNAKGISINSNKITKKKAEDMALQKVHGVIKKL